MKLPKNPSLDYLLTAGVNPITAEQLWQIVYPGPLPLTWADTGVQGKYERLAEAINGIRNL